MLVAVGAAQVKSFSKQKASRNTGVVIIGIVVTQQSNSASTNRTACSLDRIKGRACGSERSTGKKLLAAHVL